MQKQNLYSNIACMMGTAKQKLETKRQKPQAQFDHAYLRV